MNMFSRERSKSFSASLSSSDFTKSQRVFSALSLSLCLCLEIYRNGAATSSYTHMNTQNGREGSEKNVQLSYFEEREENWKGNN
jgi:hypothetical protein